MWLTDHISMWYVSFLLLLLRFHGCFHWYIDDYGNFYCAPLPSDHKLLYCNNCATGTFDLLILLMCKAFWHNITQCLKLTNFCAMFQILIRQRLAKTNWSIAQIFVNFPANINFMPYQTLMHFWHALHDCKCQSAYHGNCSRPQNHPRCVRLCCLECLSRPTHSSLCSLDYDLEWDTIWSKHTEQ